MPRTEGSDKGYDDGVLGNPIPCPERRDFFFGESIRGKLIGINAVRIRYDSLRFDSPKKKSRRSGRGLVLPDRGGDFLWGLAKLVVGVRLGPGGHDHTGA